MNYHYYFMHKILITGGLGFIGSNLIKFLIEKKYKILNIDKENYASNTYNIKKFKKLLIIINQNVYFI